MSGIYFPQKILTMIRTETFCKLLGFKQEDLAIYLDVTVHQMAQYEAGKRSLPHKARLKEGNMYLLHLQLKKDNTPAYIPEFTQQQQQKAEKILKRHADANNYKALLAERRLELMQKNYRQANDMLVLMQAMDAKEPDDTMDKSWLFIMKRTALDKLERNGIAAQTRLQLRISGLRHEEEKAKKMMEELIHEATT